MYKIHEFAELIGVSIKTLQRWDANGKLPAKRTLSNYRYYTDEDLAKYKGLVLDNKLRKIVVYCRVYSNNQKHELANQVSAMETFCLARCLVIDEVITEVGGGLNFKRKKFMQLITAMLKCEIETIVIAHKDRLCRFAFDLIEQLGSYSGSNILVANQQNLSPQQELVEDLLSIVHCFSCRLYGLRSYSKELKDKIVKTLYNPRQNKLSSVDENQC